MWEYKGPLIKDYIQKHAQEDYGESFNPFKHGRRYIRRLPF
jgi:hypothetical protein